MIRGACIPGLAMAARELPATPGVLALENPEVGCGLWLERDYTLEEVAEQHLRTLEAARPTGPLVLCGYSMGGMILAILATRLRARLPRDTRFVFLMTSPNVIEPLRPADPRSAPRAQTVQHGTEEEYAAALAPYFSEAFLKSEPRRFAAYVRYRALGLNGQSPQGLFRQLWALARCPAHEYFRQVDGREATFIGSRADRIFGPRHNAELARLCPKAQHVELDDVGHMIHHERPALIRQIFEEEPSRMVA